MQKKFNDPAPTNLNLYTLVTSGRIQANDWLAHIKQWAAEMIGDTIIDNGSMTVYRPKWLMADPGEGYRLLQEGEVIEKGDEFLSSFFRTWSVCYGSLGDRQGNDGYFLPRRRKISVPAPSTPEVRGLVPGVYPGEGYRFLKEGEKFREGDEVLNAINGTARPMISHFGEAVLPAKSGVFPEGYYRRKIRGQSPGWRYLDPEEIVQEGDEAEFQHGWDLSCNVSHRQSAALKYRRRIETPQPAPAPVPEVKPEEPKAIATQDVKGGSVVLTVTLTEKEAKAFEAFTHLVGGHPDTSARGATDAISSALSRVVGYQNTEAHIDGGGFYFRTGTR